LLIYREIFPKAQADPDNRRPDNQRLDKWSSAIHVLIPSKKKIFFLSSVPTMGTTRWDSSHLFCIGRATAEWSWPLTSF